MTGHVSALDATGRGGSVRTQVVVIGAGPAGLAVGACLQREGVPFVLLERGERVGASWHRRYRRLHLHTDKRRSHLPSLPFPADVPRYPSRAQVIAYLEAYARHFRLEPVFGQEVVSVRRCDGRLGDAHAGRPLRFAGRRRRDRVRRRAAPPRLAGSGRLRRPDHPQRRVRRWRALPWAAGACRRAWQLQRRDRD